MRRFRRALDEEVNVVNKDCRLLHLAAAAASSALVAIASSLK